MGFQGIGAGFMSWSEFFHMGGYGFYVWTSYAFAAVILILNLYLPLRRRKSVHHLLREVFRIKEQSR
jgi:heme exporter protein D